MPQPTSDGFEGSGEGSPSVIDSFQDLTSKMYSIKEERHMKDDRELAETIYLLRLETQRNNAKQKLQVFASNSQASIFFIAE